MAIFEYGKYKIDIDEEKTKCLFDAVQPRNEQSVRNYWKYVLEEISKEEKDFFDSLHVNLLKTDFCYEKSVKKKHHLYNFQTYVVGDFLSFPTAEDEMFDETAQCDESIGANDIVIGNFRVHISTPNEYDSSCDEYENSIYIEFYVNVPWLLNERYRKTEFSEVVDDFKIHLKCYYLRALALILRKRNRKKNQKLLKIELEKLKNAYSVDYEILNERENKKYKKEWVDNLLPENADKKMKREAYKICISNRQCTNYLWHIFSYEIIKTSENPIEEFQMLVKNNCTLVIEDEFAVKLSGTENLSEQDITDFCRRYSGEWCDFVITADDFSWVYSRTHEVDWCGPYFYRKDDDND